MSEIFYSLSTLAFAVLLVYSLLIYRQTRQFTTVLIALNAFGLCRRKQQ